MKSLLTRAAQTAAQTFSRTSPYARAFSSTSRLAHDGAGITIGISPTLTKGSALPRMIEMFKAVYPKLTMKILHAPYKTNEELASMPPRAIIEAGASSVKDIDGLIVPGSNASGSIDAFSHNYHAAPNGKHLHVLSQIHTMNNRNGSPIMASCAGNYYLGIYVGAKLTRDFNWYEHTNTNHILTLKDKSWLQHQASTHLSTPTSPVTQPELIVYSTHQFIVDPKTLPSSCIIQATDRDGTPAVISYGRNAIGFQDHFETPDPDYALNKIVPHSFVEAIKAHKARSTSQPDHLKMPVCSGIKSLLEGSWVTATTAASSLSSQQRS